MWYYRPDPVIAYVVQLAGDGELLTGQRDASDLSEDQFIEGGAWSVVYPVKGTSKPRILCFRLGPDTKRICGQFTLVTITDYETQASIPPRGKVIRFDDGTEFKELLMR